MSSFRSARLASHGLLAAIALVCVSAHAANIRCIEPSQEPLVKPGMSSQQVTQALGQPTQIAKYLNEVGPTWTYAIDIGAENARVFDVDFDSQGKVLSASERIQDLGRRFRH
jgi:outer membrane protein assembly factor BamE (lipoprotein component of BamABCDE complex)